MADDPKVTNNPKITTNLEEANEVGYLGSVPDPTPNEAYTVAGVTSSDVAAKADSRAAAGQMNIPPDPTVDPPDQTVEPDPKPTSKKSSS